MAKKKTKKRPVKKKNVRKIKKVAKKRVKKMVKKQKKKVKKVVKTSLQKVKVDGIPLSQKEVFNASIEISGATLFTRDNVYEAAMNALENRTVYENIENLDVFSGSRLPIVLVGHNALLNRDNGAMITLPENNQEMIDDILICHKICENKNVLIPGLVDSGILLSENVSVPSKQSIEKFIGKYKPLQKEEMISLTDNKIDADVSLAMAHVRKLIAKTNEKWMKKFHRGVGMIETEGLENAKVVLIVYGQNSRSTKKAIMDLASPEQEGQKPINVGLIRVHIARPFPIDELTKALELVPKKAKIGVIDISSSAGMGGIMFSEVSSITSRKMSSYVSSKLLGTKNILDIISTLLDLPSGESETLWIE
ncbi:hypothetical protein CL614_03805 [archaeon]|nr:hypothetical protein [archaeon]|tara:strand:+ start:807 stop:1901 length:1095 start_codon:yes stop_codon:yes gene_type:complete